MTAKSHKNKSPNWKVLRVKERIELFFPGTSYVTYPSVCVGELIEEIGGTRDWASHWRLDVGSEVIGLVEVAEVVVGGGWSTGWE